MVKREFVFLQKILMQWQKLFYFSLIITIYPKNLATKELNGLN